MKLSNTRLAALVSVFGFGMFLSGPMTSASLAKFGESLHTSITNLVSAFVFTVRGAFVNESAGGKANPLHNHLDVLEDTDACHPPDELPSIRTSTRTHTRTRTYTCSHAHIY